MADIVDGFNKAKQAIFDHCKYVEDWAVIPLDDNRDQFWALDEFEREWCKYSPKK